MYITGQSSTACEPGPAVFCGYCRRTNAFRMMDFDEYMNNVRESYGQWQKYTEQLYRPDYQGKRSKWEDECCVPRKDCHCECCVCDADVLVHARCGEQRLISLTFDNDTRRERDVHLTLGEFSTAGGFDLNWSAALTPTDFTLGPCASQVVTLKVGIDCRKLVHGDTKSSAKDKLPSIDRCEVAYATVRAEGCLSRPVVVAVAVLPDDCDSYESTCGCDCC